MSIIKNGQISLFCHFNKIIKGSSFQCPALNQKHFRNVCQTAHQYLTKFSFDSTQDSKEISISVTSAKLCSSAYDYVTDLEFVDFTKTIIQISQERNIFSFKKNSLVTHQGLIYCNKQFCSRGYLQNIQYVLHTRCY